MKNCLPSPAATDDHISFASEEFMWSSAELSDSHRYLGPPVKRMLRNAEAQKILDLGCGNGAFTAELAAAGFATAGCDASASGIALARRHFPQIPFFAHNLEQPISEEHLGRYDAVVSVEVIEHLLLPRLLLQNASAALRPGGRLIVSTPFHGYWKNLALALANKFDDHWHPLRDFGHIKFFSKKTMLTLLKEQGFSTEEFLPVGRVRAVACWMVVAARKL